MKKRELVSFRLGAQEFCVDIMAVKEIRGSSDVARLPRTPAYVLGMINLRGAVLPVVDMAMRFGLKADSDASRRVIVVVWIGRKLVGLMVDAVCDIIQVDETMLQPPPDIADGGALSAAIAAVVTVDERMIALIALDQILPGLESVAA